MGSSAYGRFMAWLHLESDKINVRLLGIFLLACFSQLELISRTAKNISSSDFLTRLMSSPSLALLQVPVADSLKPLQAFIDNNFGLVMVSVFVVFFLYQLFVITVVTSIVKWIAKHRGIVYYRTQIYNSLLLVYSAKTLVDVFVVRYFLNWLFFGLTETWSVIVTLLVNIGTYWWLYIILKEIDLAAPPERIEIVK